MRRGCSASRCRHTSSQRCRRQSRRSRSERHPEACSCVQRCSDDGVALWRCEAIPDDALRQVLTAAVKAYAAKAEAIEVEFAPFEPDAVTATEVAVAAC